MIKAIIFDMDFTLYNHTFFRKVLINKLKKYAPENVVKYVQKNYVRLEASTNPKTIIEKFKFSDYESFKLDYLQSIESYMWDIKQVLDKASNYPTAIVTNANVKRTKKKLDFLQFKPDVVVCCTGLLNKKPLFRSFKKAIKKLGFSGPEVLSIGDSFLKDILPSKLIGFRTFYFSYSSAFFPIIPTALNPFADYKSDSLIDVIKLL